MKNCFGYVGVSCVNSCPNALASEYSEYGYEYVECSECGLCENCEDCALPDLSGISEEQCQKEHNRYVERIDKR